MQVEVKNLVRHFGRTKAVDGISFEFNGGDVYGFVGPNGAGKTTTMRIIATLDEPDSGDILIDGVSLIDYPEKARRGLGFMPDSLPAHRDISVEEYIDFFARAYGLRGDQRSKSVEGVLEFTNLLEIRWKMLSDLSKGMKQRVSLARAMVHNPGVIVMDEPAAGLDPRARVELRELLKILRDQGKAILISSHILTELSEICTGAVIIEQGKVLRAGNIDRLMHQHGQPQHQEVILKAMNHDSGSLAKILVEMPLVQSIVSNNNDNGEVRVAIDHGDTQAGELLKMLLDRGIQIINFTPVRLDLEDVFMAITEGKVQQPFTLSS